MKSIAFGKLVATSACWLLLTTAHAQEGDAVAGEFAFSTCSGCHAVPGYTNAYPTYHVPRIGGQSAQYVADALRAYRDQMRGHKTMHANAAGLSEADISNISTYISQQENDEASIGPVTGDAAAGEALAATCTSCHGEKGNKPLAPNYPRLAGQYEDYLFKAMQDYKNGVRNSPSAMMMAPMVANMDDEQLSHLAAYFASQTPALSVIEFRAD